LQNFLPKATFNQFRTAANLYFLFIAIIQSIPVISPLSPITSWLPLVLVIGISMTREAFEDCYRYRSDKQTNAAMTLALINGKY
jgi:hypothetical protein